MIPQNKPLASDFVSRWLMRCFVGDEENASERRARISLLEGYTSVFVNTLLFILKLAVWWLTASIALLADSIHTLADSVTSVVVLVGAYVSRRPPDREHPFGHGRAELVSALIIAVLLGVAAFEFGKSSFLRVFTPEILSVPWWAAALIAVSVLVKEWLSRFAFTLAEASGSKALEADAWHHKTDVLATLLVVVAMVAARFGLVWVDGVMGVTVSGVILWAAVRIAKESVTPLLGEAPTEEELAEIETQALEVDGVRGVHDIIVHKYGETRIISLHVETLDDLNARNLHTLAEQVEDRVDTQGHGLVVVHVDPINVDHPCYAGVKTVLGEAVSCDGRIESFHDFRMEGDDEALNVQVDVAVHETLSEGSKAEIEAALQACLNERFPRARLKVNFEPIFAYGEAAQRRPEH